MLLASGFLSSNFLTRFLEFFLFALAAPMPETDFGFLSNPIALSYPLYIDGCVSDGGLAFFASLVVIRLLTFACISGFGAMLRFSA